MGMKPPKKRHSLPNLGPCLLWPNDRPSQLLLSTCCTAHRRVSHYFTMCCYVSSKLPLSLGESGPHLTHGTYGLPKSSSQITSRSVQPFLYGFQMLWCTLHCQWGRKPPKLPPSFCDFVTLPEEDRATAIGNMHRKIRKDLACGSGDIYAVRQTHTQTCSS